VEAGARSLVPRKPAASAPAINSGGLGFSAMGGQGKFNSNLQKSESSEVAAAPASPAMAGSLERSDGLTRRALLPSAAKSLEADSPLVYWKVAGGKLLKSADLSQWQEAYPRANTNPEFSFVVAHGTDVWAGGSRVWLVHSADGGATWENIRLGDSASGTIVAITANGANVQVKTSDNQSWSSGDGGKTWVQHDGQN
jgi:photosystem II stability/assembly factor-like uncharacterized protein